MAALHKDLHVKYVQELDSKITKQSYEYWLLEHLRLNGLYWGAMALATVGSLETLPKEEVIKFVLDCYDNDAGAFVLLLRLPDGSFMGDGFGEIDTRFVFVSVYILTLLGRLTPEIAAEASDFILDCRNFDGGFGMCPGAESHAAQVYTCVGALALCDSLDKVEEKTAAWLSERQVPASGGFNGRPEKLPDVCYSWWVLLSLAALEKAHWISFEALETFIFECQDHAAGGFSDRPGNQTDVYHTCFALAGLSLMYAEKYGLAEVDPVLCLPKRCLEKITFFKKPAAQ
ncbi:hypothetical protein HF325_003082 [Metschnikowia pulcherrima]|uniref:Geranylgeranyl transferase type-2 subunit beta n=1 Tax=Metschnikowia pulcherrima TaxID=27326 RepID=A0A8H7GSB8_9ASCO|nr:hypothetical protein HF325_003082 [Metschnikowia pulcherrima]